MHTLHRTAVDMKRIILHHYRKTALSRKFEKCIFKISETLLNLLLKFFKA